MDKTLFVDLLCRLLFVDPTCGLCLETLFGDPVCGPCLWTLFADPVCGPCLQRALFASPVCRPCLQKLFANNIFRPSLWTHLQTTFMNSIYGSCLNILFVDPFAKIFLAPLCGSIRKLHSRTLFPYLVFIFGL